jgi:hypothetical protein
MYSPTVTEIGRSDLMDEWGDWRASLTIIAHATSPFAKTASRSHWYSSRCEYSHSTRNLSWISNGDKKRYEFYSRNNFHYCGLVCHRSNLESPFASVTKNKQLQQHRYIKNIPNSQWLKIVKKEWKFAECQNIKNYIWSKGASRFVANAYPNT